MNSEEVKAYLAKIRKQIAESNALVEQAKLRVQETDRLLAAQGLTRSEVLNFKVSREHVLAVNEELARRGLPPLETEETAFDFKAATDALRAAAVERSAAADAEAPGGDDALAERRRKFDTFMQAYRL